MAAASFVRVTFLANPAVSIHLDGKLVTYWDVAKAATVEHIGKSAAEDIGAGAISLRGPATGSEGEARSTLAGCDKVTLSGKVGASVYEAWFLLEISNSAGGHACSVHVW
jgi:hypothetical protein